MLTIFIEKINCLLTQYGKNQIFRKFESYEEVCFFKLASKLYLLKIPSQVVYSVISFIKNHILITFIEKKLNEKLKYLVCKSLYEETTLPYVQKILIKI